MAYCSNTDVAGIERMRFPNGFRDYSAGPPIVTATNPTLADVTGFINTIASEIDSVILRKGYQVPVTTNDYIKGVNAMGAAWYVEVSLNVSGNADLMKVAEQRYLSYQRMLQSIENNPRLAGVIPASGAQNNIVTSDGITGYQNTDAEFKINERNW